MLERARIDAYVRVRVQPRSNLAWVIEQLPLQEQPVQLMYHTVLHCAACNEVVMRARAVGLCVWTGLESHVGALRPDPDVVIEL